MSPVDFESYIKELDTENRPEMSIFTYDNQISDNHGQLEIDFGV